jgi:hypothetical protein
MSKINFCKKVKKIEVKLTLKNEKSPLCFRGKLALTVTCPSLPDL